MADKIKALDKEISLRMQPFEEESAQIKYHKEDLKQLGADTPDSQNA